MAVDLTRHTDVARDVAKNLVAIYIAGDEIPFERAVTLATATVKEMVRMHSNQVSKGNLTRSVGGGKTAWQHFGEYFLFSPNGTDTERGMFALGYDSRHWIWTGDKRIPWRLLLCPNTTSSDLPTHVEDKIQRRYMRDGFSWVYYDSNSDYNRNYTFILIPEEKLPAEDDPEYVKNLAKAVFEFLEELFKVS